MSFAQRQINLQFSDSQTVLNLDGLKCEAIITQPGGNVAFASLQLRAYGMSLGQMNAYSSAGANMVAMQNRTVTVSAGDVGSPITQVFAGTLIRSYMDFSQAPAVSFICSAIPGYYAKGTPSAPNSHAGPHNAEDIIQALATSIGFAFKNNGAHAVIQNQYLDGSVIDQIQKVARAAGFPMSISNDTVAIWPNDGTKDATIVQVGPDTGMVGYPTYWEAGFIVKTEFNPQIQQGRQIALTSSIPQSNGTWPIQNVTHELSTQDAGGAWFTTAMLAPFPYVPAN